MSLLFPLYLAGAAAIALPIVFHLIRRTPHGRKPFSTLMFLAPSPPRFVRRKRLDQVLLLCLRALALLLLALAFARPYLRTDARIAAEGRGVRRIAVLVDTSASMRRAGLWEAARKHVEEALDAAAQDSPLALYTFDAGLAERVSFESVHGLGRAGTEARILEALADIEPTWFATDLGLALTDLASRVSGAGRDSGRTAAGRGSPDGIESPVTIVVVSDIQEGAELGALDAYEWPEGVAVELRAVRAAGGNASMQFVPSRTDGEAGEGAARVRLTNSKGAAREEFRLAWRGPGEDAGGIAAFCPAGESRVVHAPPRPAQAGLDRLVLSGDDSAFDNTLFDRLPLEHPVEVVSLGGDGAGDESRSLDFFLHHLFPPGPVSLLAVGAAADLELDVASRPLVVMTLGGGAPVPSAIEIGRLLEHVENGGVLLAVLAGAGDGADGLRTLLDDALLEVHEVGSGDGFALLGEIDFAHPLFAPLSDPRYSDFTKIRFWDRRRVAPLAAEGVRVLARFEDGAPFLVERAHGAGRVLVMTSSWLPADSDLARSTKFVPLIRGLLRLGPELDPAAGTYLVGDSVPVAPRREGVEAHVVGPAGTRVPIAADALWFSGTDQPGHYELALGSRTYAFTVHLDPRESRTDPLDPSRLERSRVTLVQAAADTGAVPEDRQELVRELEQRQKLWRWLILGALGALLFETFWAGRLVRGTPSEPASGVVE